MAKKARKNVEKKNKFKNFSAAIFLFVQQRKKRSSTNNLLGSRINLEKKLQLFLYTEFPHPGE